jgi:Xaa-Pro aminopeptidase
MEESRVDTIKNYLNENLLDAFLISDKQDQFYVANYTGDDGFVVIDKEHRYIVTDARFFEQIKVEAPSFEIVDISKQSLADFLSSKYNSIAIESDSLLTMDYQKITLNKVRTTNANLVIKKMRMYKSPEEIALIAQAAEITDKVYEHILDFIKVGMSELEVADEIEAEGKRLGAQKLSFETIVASGIRSSYPHGNATEKSIDDGDVVTLDFGFVYNNYYSDITRTVVMGHVTDEIKQVYEIVKSAEELGMKFAPMVESFGDLDRVVRGYIDDKGYGQYFNHGTGHGLGLVCHDYPIIRTTNDDELEDGIVFTIEPGIYLPDKFGIRIEDDMYKDEEGNSVHLTTSSNDLFIIQ